jgi:hypothetical protein
MKTLILFSLVVLSFSGCKDATQAQFKSLGKKHIITQWGCDGKVIGKWESTGNVSNESNSDGWYFEDSKTGKLVEITGSITIELE